MIAATGAPSVRLRFTCTCTWPRSDALPHGCAQGRFHRIEIERHVEVHVESAVIDRFDGKDQFA